MPGEKGNHSLQDIYILIISYVNKPSMKSLCFVPLILFFIALGVLVFTYSNSHGIFSCVETLIYSADFLRVVVYNKLVKSVFDHF